MWQKDHRKSKKACVPRKKFEVEPEYYSFDDNYDYVPEEKNSIGIE